MDGIFGKLASDQESQEGAVRRDDHSKYSSHVEAVAVQAGGRL